MVRLFLASLFLSAIVYAQPRLQMEFSKGSVYSGESLNVLFWLESEEREVLDVEVSKFPEFRAFWSENQVLRQGTVTLFPDGLDPAMPLFTTPRKKSSSKLFRALIGSYGLVPMVGRQDCSIEPMKVKVSGSKFKDITLESQGPTLSIRPLPPSPPQWQKYFQGAVGQFQLSLERTDILFDPDEPVLLRFLLNGQGDFPEIHNLLPELPEELDTVSSNNQMVGNQSYGSKSFDYQLNVKTKDGFTFTPAPFVFFDPEKGKFQEIKLPAIHFEKAPPKTLPQRLPIGERWDWQPHPHWTRAWGLQQAILFLAAIGLLPLGLYSLLFWKTFSKLRASWKNDPLRKRHRIFNEAQAKLKKGDWDGFLKTASTLSFEVLRNRYPKFVGNDSALLEHALQDLGFDEGKALRVLTEQFHARWYGPPPKPAPPDSDSLKVWSRWIRAA